MTPLQTESFKFDTVDLMGGNVVGNRFDFGMGKKLSLLRTYNSHRVKKQLSFGNFTHNFDWRINLKVAYKKELIASSLKRTPKMACEQGWEDIASSVYMGKLESLHATFDKTTKLCNVYDEYHNLKTTLVIKNKKRKKVISQRLKLLQKPDATQILFYKKEDGTWANTLNAPMNFTQTDEGYQIILNNGDIHSYDNSGKLVEIKMNEKIITLTYRHKKLIQVSDNFEHNIDFSYRGKLIHTVHFYDDTEIGYSYNKHKQLRKVIYADKQTERYTYTEYGRLFEVYRNGILQKTYSYDIEGKVDTFSGIKESNPISINYGTDISVEENGHISTYGFILTHSQAKIYAITSDEGTVVYAYDDNAQLLSTTDTLGITRITMHDKKGLLKEEIDNAGTGKEVVIKKVYDADTRKVLIEKKPNVVTYNVHNDKGEVVYKVDTLVDDNGAVIQNKIEHTEYDAKGLVKIIEAGESKSEIRYDDRGNVVEVKDHLGLREKATQYNKADLPLKTIDSDGEVTQTQYDATGKMLSQVKDGKKSTMKYDKQGRLIERTSIEGMVSYFKYDDFGNIIETAESSGEKIYYTYNAQNNLTKTRKYFNEKLVYAHDKAYDDKHRVISETDAYGHTTTYSYNDKGQKVQTTDAKGNVTRYEYDEIGNLSKEINAEGGETSYEYDTQGHQTKITTPNGATFIYAYDGFGRLTEESNPDRDVTTYAYDASDKLLSAISNQTKTNAKGDTKRNIYDKLGRLARVEYDDSDLNVYYTYDKKSQLTKVADASGMTEIGYDKEKELSKIQTIGSIVFRTQHSYTEADNVATFTYPSGKTISYTYNDKAEKKSLSIDGETFLSDIHIKNGQIDRYRYADGTEYTRDYNLNERVTKLNYPDYSEVISYDELSNIVSIYEDDTSKMFTYDIVNRLITYDINDTSHTDFEYDANGNRMTMHNADNEMTNYLYMVNSNILQSLQSTTGDNVSYSYDESGNIIDDGQHTYHYDARNRLVGVDDNVIYQYNSDNQRVSKIIDGVTTYYIYDGHKLLGEYDQEGNTIKEYVYLEDTPVAILYEGKVYTIYADHLNTPRRILDENHTILWQWKSIPFGESKARGLLTFNLRFPGQYYDEETGHHYNINRDYNPVTGRYIQSDPVGFKGGANTYAYAEANPVTKKDEMGLWASWDHMGYGIHQSVNKQIFGNTWKTRLFNNATVAVDRKQGVRDSFLHAMRDGTHRESISQARTRANHHVRTGFGMARYYINRGDGRNAYHTLGWVLHTLQDSTSPAHKYFQPWYGASMGSSAWWRHVNQEKSKSQLNNGIYNASRYVWHMFYYRLVPSGNVFIF